jgi:hypothetical protein
MSRLPEQDQMGDHILNTEIRVPMRRWRTTTPRSFKVDAGLNVSKPGDQRRLVNQQ